MSIRPVFIPSYSSPYVQAPNIEFTGISGFSEQNRMQHRNNFHDALDRSLSMVASDVDNDFKILEISSISDSNLGRALSALNLEVELTLSPDEFDEPAITKKRSVESWYQSAKIFDEQNPIHFAELQNLSGQDAKNAIELNRLILECKQLGMTHFHPFELKPNLKRLLIKKKIADVQRSILNTLQITTEAQAYILGHKNGPMPQSVYDECLKSCNKKPLLDGLMSQLQKKKLTPYLKIMLSSPPLPAYLDAVEPLIHSMPNGLEWFQRPEHSGDVNKWSESELNDAILQLNIQSLPIEDVSKKIFLKRKKEQLTNWLHVHIIQLAHKTMNIRHFRSLHKSLSMATEDSLQVEDFTSTVLRNITAKICAYRIRMLRHEYRNAIQNQFPNEQFDTLEEFDQMFRIQTVRTINHDPLSPDLLSYCLHQINHTIHDGPFNLLLERINTWFDALIDQGSLEEQTTILDDLLNYTTSNPIQVIGYRLNGDQWPASHPEALFTWLYFTALQQQPDLLQGLREYTHFTDIFYNPYTTVNCQARAAALAAQLLEFEHLDIPENASWKPPTFSEVMSNKETFIQFCKEHSFGSVGRL